MCYAFLEQSSYELIYLGSLVHWPRLLQNLIERDHAGCQFILVVEFVIMAAIETIEDKVLSKNESSSVRLLTDSRISRFRLVLFLPLLHLLLTQVLVLLMFFLSLKNRKWIKRIINFWGSLYLWFLNRNSSSFFLVYHSVAYMFKIRIYEYWRKQRFKKGQKACLMQLL